MTIKEFFEIDFNDFEEIKIFKDTDSDDNLIAAHSCYHTETIIEKYGHYKIKQFWVNCEESDYCFILIV